MKNRTSLKATFLVAAGIGFAATMIGCSSNGTARNDDTHGSLKLGLADESSNTQTVAQTESKPRTTRSSSWGTYSPSLRDGETMARMAFPTGEVRTSAILLHQVMPGEVVRGSEFDFSYHVTNLTSNELQNVIVTLNSKSNLEIVNSDPRASESAGDMVWALGTFAPEETKIIRLTGKENQVGQASDCITVSYNNFLCASLNVVEPALALSKTATARTLKCDEIIIRYVVQNTGTGAASGVTITDTLASGLSMANGSRNVSIPVGTLASGESKTYEVKANAASTGSFSSPASASADNGLEASADATTTVVVAPELSITSNCSETQFLGRNMTFGYTIKNVGNGEAASTVATATIPAGTSLVRSSEGGRVSGNRVTWDYGTLPVNATRDFSITVKATDTGDYTSSATANAECADAVSDTCTSGVKGIPAVLLEVVDITDPVEVGGQTTYVITVTNQGSAEDTNVRVVATLPSEQGYVGSTGATAATVSGQKITFSPVRTLEVGGQASWRITVKANSGGDVRFRLEMTSDNLTSPVIETEATNLYE
ncbi:MAG: DUF11 domain-containing protein [Phycisphaerales bacterium]|nr:DUF11 domain-containing protein [Phycisphaerales bacterium]